MSSHSYLIIQLRRRTPTNIPLPRIPADTLLKQLQSITIHALSGASEHDDRYRVAEMTLDPKSRINLVAKKLATEILELQVQPLNGESTEPQSFWKRQTPVEGYVDIQWRTAQDRTTLGPTRFLVTSTFDPDYDLVLGKQDCLRLGLLAPKKSRRWFGKQN